MFNEDDDGLSLALKSNDEAKIDLAFKKIYSDYSHLIFFIVSKYVNDEEEIKDIVQDTFINLFNNASNITNLKAYLAVSARNLSLDYLRKTKNITLVPLQEEVFQVEDYSSSRYADLIQELSLCLTQEEINILIQHSIFGLSFKEISQMTKSKENTVKTIYHRSINKYKKWRKAQ